MTIQLRTNILWYQSHAPIIRFHRATSHLIITRWRATQNHSEPLPSNQGRRHQTGHNCCTSSCEACEVVSRLLSSSELCFGGTFVTHGFSKQPHDITVGLVGVMLRQAHVMPLHPSITAAFMNSSNSWLGEASSSLISLLVPWKISVTLAFSPSVLSATWAMQLTPMFCSA